MLQKETYAVAIQDIKEIIEYSHLTTVPTMPGFIRGIINLRGCVVPVVDGRARFEGKKSEISRLTCIVIIEIPAGVHEGLVVGLIVDEVKEVLEIPVSEIEVLPAIDADTRNNFIKGIGKINGHFVIILDAARVLSAEQCSLLDQEESLMDIDLSGAFGSKLIEVN
jgi:purine-binding chemotaxis protein CheW